jgi:hypothetical protein
MKMILKLVASVRADQAAERFSILRIRSSRSSSPLMRPPERGNENER